MTVQFLSVDTAFDGLIAEATACRLCPRMANSSCVIGRSSGRIDADLMFIGEAPGRLGADASMLPFHGDKSGDNFELLLEQVGLSRYQCFVTNAVLCNPKDEQGNNATPTKPEVTNCSPFLTRQIDIVRPKVIATLGAQALGALNLIEPHGLDLSAAVRTAFSWRGKILVPLYHPGQRAMIHRSFLNQLADYQFLAEQVRRNSTKISPSTNVRPTSVEVGRIARMIISYSGYVSYFNLHKIMYLVEYEYFKLKGMRLTKSYIIRQKDGPYITDLNIRRLKKYLSDLNTSEINGKIVLSIRDGSEQDDLFESSNDVQDDVSDIVKRIVKMHGQRPEAELKRLVYLTKPMRAILRKEKYHSLNMFNAPISF